MLTLAELSPFRTLTDSEDNRKSGGSSGDLRITDVHRSSRNIDKMNNDEGTSKCHKTTWPASIVDAYYLHTLVADSVICLQLWKRLFPERS